MTGGRVSLRFGLAAVVCTLTWAAAWPAEDQPMLRQQLLELNNVTGSDPIEGQIRALLAKPAETKKLLPIAAAMLKEKNPPLNFNALYILGRAAHELKEVKASEALYRAAAERGIKLQSRQRIAQAFGGLIDLFYDNKKYDETVQICREFLDIRGSEVVNRLKPAVLERLIESVAKQGKLDEALKMVDKLVKAEEEGNGWWYLQLKGRILREANRLQEAAKVYEQVSERLPKDKSLKSDQAMRYLQRNRYILSGVYVDLNLIDKAAEQLQALLKEKPDDPTYNNDLGYIWADHDMKLEEAEKLIRKAIEQDRKQREELKKQRELEPDEDQDNPAYLDSLGWVMFKQKKYPEAKKYLLEAIKTKEGQHIEIFDHLGDVHMALSEKAEAVAAWKKGVEATGPGKREKERKAAVEKKIKANQ